MGKLLEKALKDAINDDKCVLGAKEVIQSIKDAKLVVISKSLTGNELKQIQKSTTDGKISTLNYGGTSIALGKLCGLQFRVSAASLTSIADTNVKAILKEESQ
ncbi:MAG TPA: 50S ribosomal protein L7ae [Candidatus Nitrosotenuis sp.]|mgnify:FL=1|jgi:large subunit ribosomal protein L30e|nr:50S ribosomal protein L7ae [Candidatus Nitrosotenuis sp.]HIH68202.1 50S ribosomal protein L7ae [Candidatus Nitrosotenuis sp.]HII03871.1 50S ribosomal protein L7ae [Candidatus Nitrosotenuis sp.]